MQLPAIVNLFSCGVRVWGVGVWPPHILGLTGEAVGPRQRGRGGIVVLGRTNPTVSHICTLHTKQKVEYQKVECFGVVGGGGGITYSRS